MEIQTPIKPVAARRTFTLAQARQIVQDLYAPNLLTYSLDFGITVLLGHAMLITGAMLPYWLPEPFLPRLALQALCLVVNILCYYRASVFIHELVHLRPGTFNTFRLMYHALFGVPCFLPTFLYYTHMGHHRSHYGTKDDAEYVPLELRSRWVMIVFVILSFFAPIAGIGRFLIMAPLGWMIPPLRRRYLERRSSLVFDVFFLRPQPSARVWRIITVQEIACFLWAVTMVTLLCTVLRPWAVSLIIQFYLAIAGTAFINSLRTLVSHRWAGDHEEMTWEEQLLDSTIFPDEPWWLNELWAPVGERFHATHHLFPTMPYHNLGIAHRRLMEQLPKDSIYRDCNRESFFAELRDLWRRAGSRRPENAQSPATLSQAS